MTSSSTFQAHFRSGQRVERSLMVVLWRRAEPDQPRRVGFTVSRQVRGAVSRNRVKRRLREAYRETRDAGPPGISLVIVGRPGMLGAPMQTVLADMRQAFRAIPGQRTPA